MKKVFVSLAVSYLCCFGWGCGSSGTTGPGGGAGGGNNGGGGNPNPAFSKTFTVNNFGGSQSADLVLTTAQGQGAQQTFNVNAANKEAFAAKEELPVASAGVLDEPPADVVKDLPADVLASQRALVAKAARSGKALERTLLAKKFDDLNQGALTSLRVNGATVQLMKMQNAADTLHCNVLAQVAQGNPVVSQQVANSLADAWDNNNPFRPGDGIYNQVRAVYGHEWETNPVGGRDGDVKINLVLLNSATIGGSSLFGFFQPGDELSVTQNAASNEGEILYLNSDKATGDLLDVLSTMAHEFQHLVSFNVKEGHNGLFDGDPENASIDEGKSVLAEELTGFSLEAAGGGNRFIYITAKGYLSNTANFLFFQFNAANGDYGKGYLMMRYLYFRFGASAFRLFATAPTGGKDNISNSFGVPFDTIFRDWAVANYVSPLAGNVPAQYRYGDGFNTAGTFNIRGEGITSLPGVVPQATNSPPNVNTSTTQGAYTASYRRFTQGSGQTLTVTAEGPDGGAANLIVQPANDSVSQVQ